MSYTEKDFPTKKALKEAVASGEEIRCYNPGLGPSLTHFSGTVYLEGPHFPKPHKWYASAKLINGLIQKGSVK